MIEQALQAVVDSLKTLPGTPVPEGRIGTSPPALATDVPALRVRPVRFETKPVGIGNLVQSRLLGGAQWEETTAERGVGRVAVDVFAVDATQGRSVVDAVGKNFTAPTPALRAAGFLKVGPVEWQPEQSVTLGTTAVFLQSLFLDAIFEALKQDLPDPGGVIQRIDVSVKPPVEESMTIT